MKATSSPGHTVSMATEERVWRERGLREAVLAGDERAWRLWYDESFADLHAYALWRCAGLRHDADEVVQETWLTAVRRIRDFEPSRGSFAGWLKGMAAQILRNHWRRRRQRRAEPLTNHDPAAPKEDASEQEQAQRIAVALAELEPRYEAVLRAKYLEQRAVQDIAEAGSETVKAIESLLTRARHAFRLAYDKQEAHP